jgi:L-malate glycosyltransferase
MTTMRYVLLGDGDSPHLLKWALALAAQPGIELWAASSRGFLPGFDACLPAAHRLQLNTRPQADGGNVVLLRHLPVLARWLRHINAPWVHAHYLTSHGTLAWLARRYLGVRGQLVGSAWGSDILLTPQTSRVLRWATRQVLQDCRLTTSDSQHMASHMHGMGAREVMVFPFGLEALPPEPPRKDPHLFFANRGLHALYAPQRVLAQFAAVAGPLDRLVVANEGPLLATLQAQAQQLGLTVGAGQQVQFVGRLGAQEQAGWYARAGWYISLPSSDSVSVSVLEAMAHGCLPLLSDLPANHELVQSGVNGLIAPDGASLPRQQLDALWRNGKKIATRNRHWVREHALFKPAVQRFVQRLGELS